MTSFLQKLNNALDSAISRDERIFLLGEDILDPYGGAFKVTRGLSSRYPGRVISTPISESAMIGIASGMAMRGLRPIVEIMFGDFMTLTADQVINHAAKFRWVYQDKVSVPIIIRTPMGGRRGYGPTHSQSIEKIFMGIPGLRVVAPNTLSDPSLMLDAAIEDDDPVLFIEHKLLYPCQMQVIGKGDFVDAEVEQIGSPYPSYKISYSSNAKICIATYGYNFELVRQAALELLFEKEIFVEIFLFSQLSPFNVEPIMESLKRTRRLLTVEEGNTSLGWGAEIAALVTEKMENIKIKRLGSMDLPIANAPSLEGTIIPSKSLIKETIIDFVNS